MLAYLIFLLAIYGYFIRMKAQNFPVNEKKIILPPFFMATGALMYVIPYFRLTGTEILESIILGVLFSTVLIWTSHFEVHGTEIYMKRSKSISNHFNFLINYTHFN